MRRRLVFVVLIFSVAVFADTKIKTRNTTMGHSTEGTVFIKGARERMEVNTGMGPSFVNVTQCDQKRIITINPQANTCMVTPLGGDEGGAASPVSAAGATKGGTIIFNINTLDTGERQKMLGLNARHMKMTMNVESSPDACSKANMHSESDGWFADIAPQMSCSMGFTPPPSRGGKAGCQDSVRFKRTGSANPGYPLKLTMTMQVEGHSFTTTSEVVELTNTPLEASLFDMPAGCRVVSSYAELMNVSAMIAGAMGGTAPPANVPAQSPAKPEPPAAPVAAPAPVMAAKGAGVTRVGVAKIKDDTGTYLPLDNLRINLMSEVTLRQFEAVPLDSDGEAGVAAEAASKQCDYILYTDATQVKAPDAGGVVLPAALKGVTLDKSKYQALLAVTVYKVGKPQPELKQVPIAADGEKLGVNAVMAAFEKEADRLADQVRKPAKAPVTPAKAPAKKVAPKKPS